MLTETAEWTIDKPVCPDLFSQGGVPASNEAQAQRDNDYRCENPDCFATHHVLILRLQAKGE
jgi:hypothetical protein